MDDTEASLSASLSGLERVPMKKKWIGSSRNNDNGAQEVRRSTLPSVTADALRSDENGLHVKLLGKA
jgi:hypothetical protein